MPKAPYEPKAEIMRVVDKYHGGCGVYVISKVLRGEAKGTLRFH